MSITQKSNMKRGMSYALLTGIFCIITVFTYYYLYQYEPSACALNIIPFDRERDTDDVVALFKDNWYWLIASEEYDVDFMLENRAPSVEEPLYYGKLDLKVMRDKEGFKGFLAYYKKNFYIGQLLFVAIKKEFRNSGNAQKLVDCALHEFHKMGVIRVKLVTRVENFPAQAVYKKAGFEEVGRDEVFVYFEKSLR